MVCMCVCVVVSVGKEDTYHVKTGDEILVV